MDVCLTVGGYSGDFILYFLDLLNYGLFLSQLEMISGRVVRE